MTSIRARLTLAYVVAVAATLVLFSSVLWSAARTAANKSMQQRTASVAHLATTILEQSSGSIALVVTADSLVGAKLEPGVRRFLDGLPGYLIIAD